MSVRLFSPEPLSEINRQKIDWLCQQSDFRLATEPPAATFLIVEDGRVGLADQQWPKVSPVFVDFVSGVANHRRLYGGGKGQAVTKAVGLNKRAELMVLDATAGLGRDAFVLATLGATVHLLERNPVVYLMLADGLERLGASEDPDLKEIAARMILHRGSLLASALPVNPDVVYLDPMFPVREKSAKIKKDMAMFHHLVGQDVDADELLPRALDLAKYRVAVKRPKGAPYLSQLEPTLKLEGKSNRFDIYTKKAL
ncbi:MAG: class I SAM-dependent methyltransferase [Reinekea sp.]|jgi:16S rRNA (guanine1516-N2)-methyltransferase